MGRDNLPTLDLFLSLDVALELIHAARDSMKRLESFFPPPPPHGGTKASRTTASLDRQAGPWSATGFPGPAGRKLRETLEEIFILLLIALRERHFDPGFERAIGQMRHYKPTDLRSSAGAGAGDEQSNSPSAVAPLLGFFELVHIGDTIGSMIQVYFDREMSPYIDTTDFLGGVMREKKKFENALDEEVAKGLNAGTEVLMSQVEHVMWSRTTGREYCPPEDTVLAELGPTTGCKGVIDCLDMHCRVVRGSTSREVLEVFYVEVGMRLHA
jgi:recyclin-1